MKTVCAANHCTGCKACETICPVKAINIVDSIEAFNAEINTEKCINCKLCEKVCPNLNIRELAYPIFWKQGWAEKEYRSSSSSGGAAAAITKSFIQSGGYVASCLFKEGRFIFDTTNDLEKARLFSGSKYVKSDPGSIYGEIQKLINQGNKVLFIGLPCQSAAVRNYLHDHKNLYTADLICHGTPSPKLLDQFIIEQGLMWEDIQEIKFRDSKSFGLFSNGKRIVPKGVKDSYLMAFLNCIDYTENCYSCRYATIDRVSDITFGDAWGQLSDTEKEGVSLILCQTQKGVDLVSSSGMHLQDVNLELAVSANAQLRHPSKRHPGREAFMNCIIRGKSFKWATLRAMPKESIKQSVKSILIKYHILKTGDTGGVLHNDI